MKAAIHRIGNSKGVILPKPLLAQIGLDSNEIEMTVERDAIVIRRPKRSRRVGWAEAAKRLHNSHDDELVWPELRNEVDSTLTW